MTRGVPQKDPSMEFFLQIVLILACLFCGAGKGGVALGPARRSSRHRDVR